MKKIVVYSPKGGVGKSTIAVRIASMLSEYGHKVGLLDIDVDCPNTPEIMNIKERDVELTDGGIAPKIVNDIEVMSIGLIADTRYAILWSAERRVMSIEQMLSKVDWNVDVLVIDSPPGTGDEIKAMITKFEPDGIVMITTNHSASVSDVKRGLAMLDVLKAKNKLLGIVKNITCYTCSKCGFKSDVFGGNRDEEIEKLTIANVPYVVEDSLIDSYLEPVVEKIEKVI